MWHVLVSDFVDVCVGLQCVLYASEGLCDCADMCGSVVLMCVVRGMVACHSIGVCVCCVLCGVGLCAWVGVWVCMIVLARQEEGGSLCLLGLTHTAASHTHTFGAMAAGAGDGGEGGWRKQNKIKN